MNLFFSECFFYLPKLTRFFRKSATIKCARWAEKKHMVFFGNTRPKSNARAQRNTEKKHSGLIAKHVKRSYLQLRKVVDTIL